MANPYLVAQLDTSAPPGLPARVLKAQQRARDEAARVLKAQQRARDEAETKAQEKHEQQIRWLEKRKEMMQLISQASVETQVGNKIQLHDTVYEIKQTYTNSEFPDVKAFYCVEMYLNADFEWTSCFTPASISDLEYQSPLQPQASAILSYGLENKFSVEFSFRFRSHLFH